MNWLIFSVYLDEAHMFGCFSSLSFSASGSTFLNGQKQPLILYVKQTHELFGQTKAHISFTMRIQQKPLVIL